MILQAGSWTGMIDGGPPGTAGVIEAALSHLGVRRLNAVLITHPHLDHTGGFEQVILDEHPRVAYVGEGPGPDTGSLRAVGARVVRVRAGQGIAFAGRRARVLAPRSLTGDPNEDSVVLLLDVAGRRLLFTGDCTGPNEAAVGAVLARGPPLFVLKVAHHGSRYSSTAGFLAAARPRFAVISVGHNTYGHPSADTVARLRAVGSTIYSTQQNGTITLTIRASGAASWAFGVTSRPVTHGVGRSGGGAVSATIGFGRCGDGLRRHHRVHHSHRRVLPPQGLPLPRP